jgi:hypothetical protein
MDGKIMVDRWKEEARTEWDGSKEEYLSKNRACPSLDLAWD